MEKITFKDFKNGKGFWQDRSDDIPELEKQGLKDDDIIINFAYTDYGGDFFDRVAIEYFSQKEYSNCFLCHNTVYYGKNGILWGQLAIDFIKESENYPLGFRDIEDFYYTKERECQEKQAQEFLDQYKDEDNTELSEHQKNCSFGLICDKLSEYSILSSGTIDICESDLEEALQEYIEGDYKMELSIERERLADSQYIGKIE